MSLIGNHDAYTSWSPTVVLPTQTYDNSQQTPYVAPQAPVVVTNPTTNVGTVLDSDFIDQIVRRNQENIYDSTKQQHIGVVKADTLLIKTNGTGVNEEWKDLWDEIVNHSAHIVAGIQSATAQDATLATHTTDIANNSSDIAGLATALNSNFDDITANTALLATLQTNSIGNGVAIGDNAYNIGDNATSIDVNTADITTLRTDVDGHTNTLNDHAVTLDTHQDAGNTRDAQITTLNNDNFSHKNKLEKITHTSATGWFDIHTLNTHNHGNLYVGDVLWVKHNGSWVSLDPHINNLVDIKLAGFQYMTYNGNQTTILNAITQEVANSTQNLTPATPYLSLGWVSPWGYIQQERRLPTNSVIFAGDIYKTRETTQQETKLIPYLDDTGRLNSAFIWSPEFDNAVFGVNNPEKVIPNSRGGGQSNYVAGFVPSAEDVPDAFRYEYFLNAQGVWSNGYTQQLNGITTSFQDQINTRIDAHNTLKTIIDNSLSFTTPRDLYGRGMAYGLFGDFPTFEDFHTGVFTTFAQRLGDIDNDIATIDATTGKAQKDDMVIFGDDAPVTGSPVAIGYINDKGRLDTARLFDQIFNDQVFGVEDPDTVSSRRKSNAYLSGLVPTAENVTDRTTKYLRADGTWALVPVVDDTKVGNLNIFKGGTDYTFLYHGEKNFEDGIRLGAGGFFQLSSGGNSSTSASMEFNIGGSTFATMTQSTNEINFVKAVEFSADVYWSPDGTNKESLHNLYTDVETLKNATPVADPKLADFDRNIYNVATGEFMWDLQRINYIALPDAHFHHQIFWKPTGQGLTNLNVMNDRVNTLITTTNALPDFDTITSANKFCITNTANGGTISYVTPTTSDINEGTNLYYTDDRVASKITTALQGGEIANIVTNQLQAQNFIANSDIRLKENIRLISDSDIGGLEPVQYSFKKDDTKRLRYGFIAQDVEEVLPDLVHTDGEGIKGINYQDIIALLVKDNQNLRSNLLDMAKVLAEISQKLTSLEISCKYR